MREITVKELVAAFEGELVNIMSVDNYGITIDMSKTRIEYSEEDNELSFTVGNFNYDGVGSVTFKVDESIDSIKEEDGVYTISFCGSDHMADVTVTKFKTIEELEKELADKRSKISKAYKM